jgi:nitroreductase
MAVIHDVLDAARWAPSGDNTQPWRFEIRSDTSALIHGYDTRDHCVYDLDGHASQLAHGALLESIALAATRHGLRASDALVDEHPSGHLVYRVDLHSAESPIAEDPLVPYLRERTVQRRAMRRTRLTTAQRDALAQSVGGYILRLHATFPERFRMAALNASNAKIRLTIPEAFAVHKAVIEWNAKTSEDRLPDASLGAGPFLLATMRFAMANWDRVDFLNRFAGGTLLPRVALDFVPGVSCASHFALIAQQEPRAIVDRVRAGRALQRLWLTATRLGLQMQPSYTPLVFARYARSGRHFTRVARAEAAARSVARSLDDLLGVEDAAKTVFLGRLGPARANTAARSLRLPLDRLIVKAAPRGL